MSSGFIGVLSFDVHFPHERSLKGKRKYLLSLKSDLQRNVGASVAEVDYHDLWQRTRLTAAVVDVSVSTLADRLDRCERIVIDHGLDASSVERVIVTPEEIAS